MSLIFAIKENKMFSLDNSKMALKEMKEFLIDNLLLACILCCFKFIDFKY